MDQNKLESVFKKRFANHTEVVDTQEMINRLGLDQPKKRRRPFFIWMLLVGVLVGITGFLFVGSGLDQSAVTLPTQEYQSNSKEEVVSKEEIENVNIRQELDRTLSSPVEAELNDNSKIVEGIEAEQSILARTEKNKYRNETTLQSENSLSVVTSSTVYSSNNQTLSNPSYFSTIVRDQISDKSKQPLLHNQSRLTLPLILDRYYSHYYEYQIPTLNFFSEVDRLIQTEDLIKNPIEERFRKPISLQGYTTVSYARRTLESNHADYNAYIANRKLDENQLEVIQAGLSMTQPIGKYLYISSGLEYTQINEKATLTFINDTTQVENNIPTHLQILTTGDTIVTFGSQAIQSTVNRKLIEYNHHKLFSLPINIGVNYRLGKVSWFADTGVSLNFYQGFYGRMKGIDGVLVSQPSFYKPHLNFSYRAQMGGSFAISRNFDVAISVKYQQLLTSISDTHFFTQKYRFIGLKLGINYQWNK